MPPRELRRTLASFHLIIQEDTSLESSSSLISEDSAYSSTGLEETNTQVPILVCRSHQEIHIL